MKTKLFLATVICALSGGFYLYEFILQVAPGVITHELMRDLNVGAGGLGLLAGFYFFTYMPMQIPAGMMYDRFGPRILLTIMVAICATGALLFSQAETFWGIAIGRSMMGFGSAFAFIGTLVLISRWFPVHYFAALAGVVQLVGAIGALVGETPLAKAVELFGWRHCILVLAIIGYVLAIMLWLIVRDSPTSTLHHKASHKGEARRLRTVCRNPQTWLIGIYSFAMWAPIIVFGELWGVPYIMKAYHVSTTVASGAVSMLWIGIAVGCPIIGALSEYFKNRCHFLLATAIVGLIASLFIIILPTMPFLLMSVACFFIGAVASGAILSFSLVKDINRSTNIGTAIGFNNMTVVAGGALLHPLVGYILYLVGSGATMNEVPVYTIGNYQVALIIIPIGYLLSAFLACKYLKESHCKPLYVE